MQHSHSGLPRNTRDGQFIAEVKRLGVVPPCVRDAFSWLTHPVGHLPRRRKGPWVWFWDQNGEPVPTPAPPDSARCNTCIFQEPLWSQGYAGCSHSWLHDRDAQCKAFLSRAKFLMQRPDYAHFCKPIHPDVPDEDWARLRLEPYWQTGARFCDFKPALHLPSHFYVTLNCEQLDNGLYDHVEIERLRRFNEWAHAETLQKLGAVQLPLNLI